MVKKEEVVDNDKEKFRKESQRKKPMFIPRSSTLFSFLIIFSFSLELASLMNH